MVKYAAKHSTDLFNLKLSSDALLGNTYYDAARVYYQMADYTGDAKWLATAHQSATIYANYVIANRGGVPGYWNFAEGLAMDYRRTGDTRSRDAVFLLAQHAAYAADSTPAAWTASAERSREVAYAIESMVVAEQLGAPHRARLDLLVNQALGHIQQWCVDQSTSYVRPFMVGLTAEALIKYQEWSKDPRVLGAVRTAMDWLWANTWVTGAEAFKYTNVDTSKFAPGSAGYNTGGTNPASDLNLLIAPAYAWLYHETGETKYRDAGDRVFAGGVAKAYLGGGKQFNQNYRFSFDYVQWRLS